MQSFLGSCALGEVGLHVAMSRPWFARQARLLILPLLATHLLAAQATATVHGVVVDSLARHALAQATVIATPAGGRRDTIFHSAIADASGHFRIEGLNAGRYDLSVDHPSIDSTGIGALPLEIDVPPGADIAVALATPSAATLRRTLCPAAARDTTLGVALGTVRRPNRALLPGATIVFAWSDFDINRSTGVATPRSLTASAVTDSLGVYRLCGLPVGPTLLVQAQGPPPQQSGVIEDRIGAIGVRIIDFQVADAGDAEAPRPPAEADSSVSPIRFVIDGRVETTTRQPIASAQVRLFGTSRAVASSDSGQFHLAGVPAGTQAIEVLALGYYPQRIRVDVARDIPPVVVRLERTAAVLDSIRVIAKRVNGRTSVRYREVEERIAKGFGTFIREDEIARRNAFVTADIFRSMPGLTVSPTRLSTDEVVLSDKSSDFGGRCALQVFIDGVEGQPTDVNNIAPSSIHAIEIYGVSGAPPKYHVRNCGALLIWTK